MSISRKRKGSGTDARSVNESVAAVITRITTSMWFLYALVVFVGLWMRLAPTLRLDTSPSFPVMLYWVNLFQALMLPILAVGQSVLSRAHNLREQHEAEVIDRLDALAQRILALEEDAAKAHSVRREHHEAVVQQLEHIAGQVSGLRGAGAGA